MFTIKMKSFIIIWICLIILTLVINSVNAVTFQNEIYDKTSELSYDFDTEQSKDRYDINVLSKEIKKTPSTSSSSSLSYQEGAESCYTENHIKYKHGEKVIRSDPCEICLCMDGEIFCWWKKCNYRKLKNREIMNNKKQKNDKRKHRKRFDEQHKMNNNNNNNMKKLLKNFSQYYTLYSITRYDRDRDHATTDANNNNKTKIVKKNLNENMNQQIKTDDDDDDDDMEFDSSKINKKNWKKITETTTSFEPLSSLKMYNLSEKKIFSNNDNDEDENDDRRTTNELKNNQKNYNNNNNISSEYHHSKVHNLNTKENKLLLKDENINKEEFITMIHSNFNMDDKETNHHHYHHHDNNNNKNNKKNNDNENEMKKISLNSNIQKDALINRREQQLVDVPMAKHYIITSSGNIENGEITAEDDIITDTEDYILPQYKNVLYNKDKYNYNSNDNNNNNNNKDHNKNENVSGNDNNNSNNNNNNNENDNNNSINNKNNLLSNRKDNEGDEKSKIFSSDPSTLLLLSSSSSSLFSSPSQIIQRNKVTTTTDQTMNQNCIVMGNTYKIGTILPQETGNCLQCICIEGANEGEPPRVTCSPHNCPPLILPDLFDTTGY